MVSDKKKKLVEKLTQQIKDYPVIAIVNMQNLPAQQLQNMRAQLLKKDVLIVMARRRLLQLALKNSQKENIDALIEKIKGMPAVLLSKENPFIAGKHYIEVNDLKMMKNKIKYYLENQTEREEIALNGYHEATNKHTYYIRAKEFTKKFEEQTLKRESPAFNSRRLNIFSIYEQFKHIIKNKES